MNEFYNHKLLRKHLEEFEDMLPDWLDRKKLEEGRYTFSYKQIGWFDEVHVYQQVGPLSKQQYRFKWDSNSKPVVNNSDKYSECG